MESYKISRIRNRYIVPFEISVDNNSFENYCKAIDSYEDDPYSFLGKDSNHVKKTWVRRTLRSGEQDVYGYIIDEFSLQGDINYEQKIEKAGCFWEYDSLKEESFDLQFVFTKRYDESNFIPICISNMGLYLFRSGVGFLWYEITIAEDKISDSISMIKFQNMFKELARGYNNHLWIESSELPYVDEFDTGDMIPFMLGNWIAERLQFIDVKFQAERNNSYAGMLGDYYFINLEKGEKKKKINKLYSLLPKTCPDKALIFIYASFERDDEWTIDSDSIRTAYYLTNGYKETYEMGVETTESIKCPFSNVLWMATKEGCGYFAWQSKENATFFSKNQYAKIMNDYFLLYMRAIYQSYSLMKYAVYTSKMLPNEVDDYLRISDETEILSEKISRIGTAINLFLVKSIVTSVSHIQHQNDFYGYLCNQLKIKEDANSVTVGLAVLNELQQESVQKKQQQIDLLVREEQERIEQREKEADNTFQIGLGLMTFLAAISAVTDGYGIISGLASNTLTTPWMIAFGVIFAVCIVILSASIVIFIRSVRNLKGKNKQKSGRKSRKGKK